MLRSRGNLRTSGAFEAIPRDDRKQLLAKDHSWAFPTNLRKGIERHTVWILLYFPIQLIHGRFRLYLLKKQFAMYRFDVAVG